MTLFWLTDHDRPFLALEVNRRGRQFGAKIKMGIPSFILIGIGCCVANGQEVHKIEKGKKSSVTLMRSKPALLCIS
jgi:hypothetical protein